MFTWTIWGLWQGSQMAAIGHAETLPGQDNSNTSFCTLDDEWETVPTDAAYLSVNPSIHPYQPEGVVVAAGQWVKAISPDGRVFIDQGVFYPSGHVCFFHPGQTTPLPRVSGQWEFQWSVTEPEEEENDYAQNLRMMIFDSDNVVVDEENFSQNPKSSAWEYFYQVYDVLNEFVPARKFVLRSTDGKAIRPGEYKIYFNPVASVITGLAGIEMYLGSMVVPSGNASIYAPVLAGSWLPLNAKYVNILYNGPDQSTLEPPDSGGETETDPGEVDWTEPEDVAENPKPDTPKLKPEPIPPDPASCACSPWYKSIADQIMNVAEQLKWSNDNAREVQDKALSFFYKELVKIREELEKLNEKVDEGKFEPLTVVENNAISLDDEMEISTGEDEV